MASLISSTEGRKAIGAFRLRGAAGAEPLIAPKGSVALDGVSLTVNEVDCDRFGVNIIPHTLSHTGFGEARPGIA